VVEEIRIFHSVLKTGDNREINMPNYQIYSSTIINYSARENRRIDMVIGIGYGDDIKRARDLIHQVLETEATVLKDPAPTVMLLELGASSVDFTVRPWVRTVDSGLHGLPSWRRSSLPSTRTAYPSPIHSWISIYFKRALRKHAVSVYQS